MAGFEFFVASLVGLDFEKVSIGIVPFLLRRFLFEHCIDSRLLSPAFLYPFIPFAIVYYIPFLSSLRLAFLFPQSVRLLCNINMHL